MPIPAKRVTRRAITLARCYMIDEVRTMVDRETDTIKRRIKELRLEHRDLDEIIDRLSKDATMDQLLLRRLKKRKLLLKDTIERLQSQLIPDLDA